MTAQASESMELYRYLFAPILLAVAVWSGHRQRPPPPAERPTVEAARPVPAPSPIPRVFQRPAPDRPAAPALRPTRPAR